jgi:hypothetical protein
MTTVGDRLFHSGGIPVGGDLMGLMGIGNVYYVDPNNGDDARDGLRPARAVASMAQAFSNINSDPDGGSTASSGGYPGGGSATIVRMPGTETVTAAATTTDPNITIVAATCGQQLFGDRLACYMEANASYTTGPVLDVTFRNVSIYGMAFASRATGGANLKNGSVVRYIADSGVTAVQTSGGGQFFTVAGCVFRQQAGTPVGLFLEGAGPGMIYRNQFGYGPTSLGPGAGIALHGSGTNNCTDIRIKENLFINHATGIRFDNGTMQWVTIEDNYFCGCTDAFTLGSGTGVTEGFIVNNRFDTSRGASSWENSIGSGNTLENIVTDTGFQFSGNLYNFDNAGTGATV